MTKKTAVVTGANAGLGYEISLNLARKGYRVVMACRNLTKAEDAKQRLLALEPGAELHILRLDVSDPDSITQFAAQFGEQIGSLDLLINNAGIVAMPLDRNSAGHEMQMATNYLGAFSLVGQLLPYFNEERQGRIINVGSLANRLGKLALDDLNWETTPYNEWKGYARSKVALLTYTLELNRRLAKSGKNIIAVAAHPGFANTDIGKNSAGMQPKTALNRWFQDKMQPHIPKASDAARSIIHAACADNIEPGGYYGPGGFLEIAGKPKKARINRAAKVPENGRRLWEISSTMTGIHYLE